MYEAFFNLKHKPFSLLPDPEFLFLSDKHAIALSLLEYCLSGQAGFCVITGDIGSGKTTLIRAFLGRIGRDFTVGLISNTHGGLIDIASWALNAFGQKPSSGNQAETYQELMAYLIAEYGAGRQCILIVDEAQNLSLEALEELRLLSNINTGKDLLLQMVLVGQPELLEKLRRPELSQFAQRIAVSHHLTPLPFSDSRRYIAHRLKIAGCEQPIFTDMAMGAVQYFSGGVPRLINSICDMALVYAFADGAPTISEELVFRVIADRQRSGIAPFASAISADDPTVRAAISDLAKPENGLAPAVPPPAAAAGKSITPKEPAAAVPPETLVAVRAENPAPVHRSDRGQPPVQSAAKPGIESKPNGEHYFAGADEGLPGDDEDEEELLLTLQAQDEPAAEPAEAAPQHSPEAAPPIAVRATPVKNAWSELRADPTAPEHGNVARVRSNDVPRPNWQHPAADINSRRWPSISRNDGARAANVGGDLVATVTISNEGAGTAAPSRRSWWRRSFSRAK
jgi:type II secretory pathway predicted ATPase ExeA